MNVYVGVAVGAVHPFSADARVQWEQRVCADRARLRLRHPAYHGIAPC